MVLSGLIGNSRLDSYLRRIQVTADPLWGRSCDVESIGRFLFYYPLHHALQIQHKKLE